MPRNVLLLALLLLITAPAAAQDEPAPRAPRAALKLWLKGGVGAVADAKARVAVVNQGKYALIAPVEAPDKAKKLKLDLGYIGDVMMAPSGQWALIKDDGAQLRVVHVDSGSTLHKAQAAAMRFVAGEEVAWWEEGRCAVSRMAPDSSKQPKVYELPGCAHVLHVSADGAQAIVASEAQLTTDAQGGYLWVYSGVARVRLDSGARTPLKLGPQVAEPAISDDGRVVCAGHGEPDKWALGCDAGGALERVALPEGATLYPRMVSLSPGGLRLVVMFEQDKGRAVYVARRGAPLERVVERTDHSVAWWLPGEERVVFTGGAEAGIVADVERGWRARVGPAGAEVSGVMTLSDQDDRFVVGIERGAGRDLWMVELE